jgi:hypothetical protein
MKLIKKKMIDVLNTRLKIKRATKVIDEFIAGHTNIYEAINRLYEISKKELSKIEINKNKKEVEKQLRRKRPLEDSRKYNTFEHIESYKAKNKDVNNEDTKPSSGKSEETYYKTLSDDDIAELEKMHQEELDPLYVDKAISDKDEFDSIIENIDKGMC